VSNTTVAAELEDLQTLITGRPDSPDHTAESPARRCRPAGAAGHCCTGAATELCCGRPGAQQGTRGDSGNRGIGEL
jgi:hypothetical protein